MPLEKTETLRVRSVIDAMRLGAWLRSGEDIEWLAAGTIPNFVYVFCFCSLFFVVFVLFLLCFFAFVGSSELFLPGNYVPDWQPRILLGMVEARPVNVKKTTTATLYKHEDHKYHKHVTYTARSFDTLVQAVVHSSTVPGTLYVTNSECPLASGSIPSNFTTDRALPLSSKPGC